MAKRTRADQKVTPEYALNTSGMSQEQIEDAHRQAQNQIESFESKESKLIQGAIYDHGTRQLQVTFRHTGFTYLYSEISPELWQEFEQAASKGSFFGKAIRPMYAGKQL